MKKNSVNQISITNLVYTFLYDLRSLKDFVKYTFERNFYKMEEKVRISILLEIYGILLTEKQYEFMDYYYNQDLSLSEIGDNNDITRQAVRTILLKSKNKLEEYEKQLKFMQKEEKIKKCIEELEETKLSTEQKEFIKKIKTQFDY